MPNAVVLDVGRRHAVRPGLRFEVLRDGRPIALVEAEWVKPTLTIAKVIRSEAPLRPGDPVRSLPLARQPSRASDTPQRGEKPDGQ
jgi:hypothetical protein